MATRGPRFAGLRWTPLRLLWLNDFIRGLYRRDGHDVRRGRMPRDVATPWRIAGRWVWLRDSAESETLRIVMREVYKGFYEPIVPLRPGDVVLDLGAHVGGFSIPLAIRHPGVRFIAYEPSRRNYANLVANVARSGVTNVEVVNAGVWGHETVIQDRHDEANTGASKSQPWHEGAPTQNYVTARSVAGNPVHAVVDAEPVRAYPLQGILRRHGVASVRLLKLDVEGAEFSAIQSAQDLVGVESVIAEVHGDDGPAHVVQPILESVPQSRLLVLPPEVRLVQNGQRFELPHNLGQFQGVST